MKKSDKILSVISDSVKAGGGIYNASELAYLLGESASFNFIKFLSDCVKKGILRRVARGLYESVITPADPSTALYKIVKRLRNGVLNYISLESQLSYTGDISQVMIDRLTIMTKGRKGIFKTRYGTIEFIHTKKPLSNLHDRIYFDSDIKMFRAKTELAISDLTSCKRNLHMLEMPNA